MLNERGLADAVVVDDPAALVTSVLRRHADGLAKPVDLDDPLDVATLLVATGEADGCVAGATRPTADVIRAGLRILGTEGQASVSSCFLLILADGRPLAYGDCGVLPDPDAEQLASVAVSSARTFHRLTGEQPRVAMLSFSTKGSAEHPSVDKVRAATALAKAARCRLGTGDRRIEGSRFTGGRPGQCVHLSRPGQRQHRLQDHRTTGRGQSHRAPAARARRCAPRSLARLLGRRHRECVGHRSSPGRPLIPPAASAHATF